MRFDINDYQGKYVMHCKTKEEAREFCNYLYSIGKRWETGCAYKTLTCWNSDTKSICYNFNEGLYGNKQHYIEEGYTILEWSDFKASEFTKADLKDGMVVEYVNGSRRMVLGKCLIGTRIHAYLSSFSEDLKSINEPEYTIVRIWKSNAHDITEIFSSNNLTLIWERKSEPEEMTLEEVCKALGREIKIVKG